MAASPLARLRAVTQGPAHRWWALGAVQCGNFVVYMDAFIVTLALPAMARHFGASLHEVKWVMLAYMIALTMSLLLAGRLADRFGRKTITSIGMALLAVSSACCLAAPSLAVLVCFRAVQGIGGALVLANVMAEITAIFPKAERRLAMAFNASVLALGQVAGLLLGGAFIESLGWRSIFVLIMAIAGLGLALDLLILRHHPSEDTPPLDRWGALLSLLVVATPFVVIERLASSLAHPAELAGILVLAIVLLGLFIAVESRQAAPIIDLRLFRQRAFVCGALAAACYFIAAGSTYFLIPLYAQVVLGFSPFRAGLLLLPLSLALTLASQVVGRFSHPPPARVLATIGILGTAAGVYGLSCLGPASSVFAFAGWGALVGLGGGIFHPPNNSSVLAGVPPAMLGSANGFFTTSRNFGQALGVSLSAAILYAGLAGTGAEGTLSSLDPHLASASLQGVYSQAQSAALHLAAGAGLAGGILSALRGAPRAS